MDAVGDVAGQRQRQAEAEVVERAEHCVAVDGERMELQQAERRLQSGRRLTTTHTHEHNGHDGIRPVGRGVRWGRTQPK